MDVIINIQKDFIFFSQSFILWAIQNKVFFIFHYIFTNLQSLDISFLEFKLAIENYLRNKVPDQLEHLKSSNEGK
jgi:hypothetical protein